MASGDLPFRQIHLDFHTHQRIPDVGADFDPDEFADTLVNAHVNSINLFGRCHHGYIYYNSKKFKERVHPNLKCNLLKEQITACHNRKIKTPVYVTVQWDDYTVQRHPEWRVIEPDGRPAGTKPYEPGFYRPLCLNTDYVDWLKDFVSDIFDNVPVDGLWFDIVHAQDCSCVRCLEDMQAAKLNPANDEARKAFGVKVWTRFKENMTKHVRKHGKDCLVCYNAGHVGPLHRRTAKSYTQFELESLPSGGWGYYHFPIVARYARNLKECIGMNGKFHTAWGDFHSFKNQAALEFECFRMLAYNTKCSVGDQLHPRGRICRHTYNRIGRVYEEVEKREAWCASATPVTDIAVMHPEEFSEGHKHGEMPQTTAGVMLMLEEGQHQFDFIDSKSDLDQYKVLILPDTIPLAPDLTKRIERYLRSGGGVIASYKSGLTPDGTHFATQQFGVRFVGDALFNPDFIRPSKIIGKRLAKTPHVMYDRALEVQVRMGADQLARVELPYFNRTWKHYCSHRHAPVSGRKGYPAIVRNGNVVYFAHPIFTSYHKSAPKWYKEFFFDVLDMLLPDPVIRTDGPSTLVATVNEQKKKKRWVIHLLHYVPVRRGEAFDTIDDVYPVRNTAISLRSPGNVKRVALAPGGGELEFKEHKGRIEFTLPKLDGYEMVEVSW